MVNSLFTNLEVLDLFEMLLSINKKLWDIEDDIRKHEKEKNFDDKFIKLARNVYITNDIRANIKKEINLLSNSNLVEEKSYEKY